MSTGRKEQAMNTDDIRDLIKEYGMHLYSFCCNLTDNRTDADDLYQDTLLKAVELGHRLVSSGNPISYLMPNCITCICLCGISISDAERSS